MSKEDFKLILNIEEWLALNGHHFHSNYKEIILDKCPYCGKSAKMYVNRDTGVFKCHAGKCQQAGNIVKFLHDVGDITFKEALKIAYGITKEKASIKEITASDDADWNDAFSVKSKAKKSYEKEIIVEPVTLPNDFEKLSKKHVKAWDYLKGRGISDDVIEKMNCYYSEYRKRVVFVVTVDGVVFGYLARDITGLVPKEQKVLNSKGSWRSVSFWNYDNVKNSKELVICEGVVSAVKCGVDRGIALLGKTATKGQIDLIKKNDFEKIFICLDVETDDDQLKIYKQLSLYFAGKIYRVEMPTTLLLKSPISNELKEKIEKIFEIKTSFVKNEKELSLLPIFKRKMKASVNEMKDLFSESEFETVSYIANKAEYKDSGDYTFEEMDEIISKSKKFNPNRIMF